MQTGRQAPSRAILALALLALMPAASADESTKQSCSQLRIGYAAHLEAERKLILPVVNSTTKPLDPVAATQKVLDVLGELKPEVKSRLEKLKPLVLEGWKSQKPLKEFPAETRKAILHLGIDLDGELEPALREAAEKGLPGFKCPPPLFSYNDDDGIGRYIVTHVTVSCSNGDGVGYSFDYDFRENKLSADLQYKKPAPEIDKDAYIEYRLYKSCPGGDGLAFEPSRCDGGSKDSSLGRASVEVDAHDTRGGGSKDDPMPAAIQAGYRHQEAVLKSIPPSLQSLDISAWEPRVQVSWPTKPDEISTILEAYYLDVMPERCCKGHYSKWHDFRRDDCGPKAGDSPRRENESDSADAKDLDGQDSDSATPAPQPATRQTRHAR